jgi:hypothetical protein
MISMRRAASPFASSTTPVLLETLINALWTFAIYDFLFFSA